MLIHETAIWQIHNNHVGSLQTNCYFLVHNSTDKALIIDPGDDGDFISEEILRLGLTPVAIVLTHGHFDHVGAVLTLKLNFDLPIYLAKEDEKIYLGSRQSSQFWQKGASGHDPTPPIDHYLVDGDHLPEPFENWQIMSVPGHTPGGVIIHSPMEKIAFSGDTLFSQDIGRTDFSYASREDMAASLRKIFKAFDDDYLILPGHEESTSMALERPNLPHYLKQLGY